MALKVLLADDSVPAQNMGKKILTEAGYDVLAVSNGLEALRKIADAVPDIAILDIFMPGYTGLEICARLRGNAITADLPVILTVGKLEPYRPEDGEQVRSNAVIVKPFASAELVSAVRSLVGLPFAIRRPIPEVETPVAPAPSSPAPVEEIGGEDEEPIPTGFGFDPEARRTPFSASAVEEPPVCLESAIAPIPEAAPAVEPSAAGVVADFGLEPEAAAADSAPVSPALVEWWQPAQESVEQSEAAAQELPDGPETCPLTRPIPSNSAATVSSAAEEQAPQAVLQAAQQDSSPFATEDDSEDADTGDAYTAGVEAVQHAAAIESPAMAAEPPSSVAEDSVQAASMPAAVAPPAPDQASRTRAFEELFNSEVSFPLAETSAGHTDLLAQSEGVASQPPFYRAQPEMQAVADSAHRLSATGDSTLDEIDDISLQGVSIQDVTMQDVSTQGRGALDASVATASAAMERVAPATCAEPQSSGELRLDAESLADWLATGKIPQREEPPVAPRIESFPQEAARADGSALAVDTGTPGDAAGLTQAGAVLSNQPMVCYIPKEQPGREAAREYSIHAATEAEALAYFGLKEAHLETVVQTEPAQPEPETPPLAVEAVPNEAAPDESACPPMQQQQTDLLPQLAGWPEPLAAETASAESGSSESISLEFSMDESDAASAAADPRSQAGRIQQAVESVFDRFRPLLIAAIARELTRRD